MILRADEGQARFANKDASNWDIFKTLWCLTFHRKHHVREGERDIYRVMIAWDARCSKCHRLVRRINFVLN
jgi:hypothetical protein